MKLNLGCGPDLWGDIRVDTDFKTQTGVTSHPNLIADGHHLPFKDSSLNEIRCWHTLEHLRRPDLVVREMMRVCKNTIHLKFPTNDGYSLLLLRAFLSGDRKAMRGPYLTWKRHAHLWVLNDRFIMNLTVGWQINSICHYERLLFGRKGRLFPLIPWEWEIILTRNTNRDP